MRRAELLRLGSLPSYRLGEETYDPTKLGLGELMVQRNGAGNEDKWAGPMEHKVLRYFELSGTSGAYPWALQWVDTPTEKLDLIFWADNSPAAATRKLFAAMFNRLGGTLAYFGAVTLMFPTTGNHTIRAMRMDYELVTTGTVSVSGTAVTGAGTSWLTGRVPVGCRIGFGSTNPWEIPSWYEISAVGSDTGITLTGSAGTIAAGTPYVIEDLRAIVATTNATAAFGGLFIVKGLRLESFMGGLTIPAATTVDSIRAVYWLKDAAVNLNGVANGLGVEPATSRTEQNVWVGNGTTTQQLFKHNVRAALTLTGGGATNQFAFATAVSATLTGTATQNNNGRAVNAGHGTGAGSTCYYFTTSTRIYRTKALSSITAGDSTFLTGGDFQVPVWPASNATFDGTNPVNLNNIEYSDSLDMFLVANAPTTPSVRMLMTKYRADGSPMDRAFSVETRINTQSAADSTTYPLAFGAPTSGAWIEGGIIYSINSSTTASNAWLAAAPISADWEYAASTGSRLILPSITLTDADKVVSVLAQEAQVVGGTSGYNLGVATEPYRLFYRTTGISDNSGVWNAVDQSGAISATGTQIQFMAEFRTMGMTMAHCSRLMALAVIYDDTNTDSRYQFSVTESSAASKQFAWRHATAFGSSVPALRVRLYDAVTGSLLVDDNTSSPTGTWERSTDGTTFVAWTNADKTNNTTYVRYTPASLADSIQVRANLTLL